MSDLYDSPERTAFFSKHQFPFFDATAEVDGKEIAYPYALYTCHAEDPRTIAALSDGAVQVARTFDKVLEDMASWNDAEFEKWGFAEGYSRIFRYAKDKPFCLRTGWGRDTDGLWKLIEINSQTPAFWIETEFGNPLLSDHFDMDNPHPESLNRLRTALNQTITAGLATLAAMPENPVVGFVAGDHYEDIDNIHYLSNFCDFQSEVVNIKHLYFTDNDKPYNIETGQQFDCLMMWYPVEWLFEEETEDGKPAIDVFLNGIKRGAFCMPHAMPAFFIQPKSILAYITQNSDKVFTGDLTEAKKYFTETYSELPDGWKDYVVKPVWGREGRGVQIFKDGKNFVNSRYMEDYYLGQAKIYQKFLELPTMQLGDKKLVIQYESWAYRTRNGYESGGIGTRATEHLITDDYSYWLPIGLQRKTKA